MMLLPKLRQHMWKSCSIIHSVIFVLCLAVIACSGADMQSEGLPSEYFPLKVGLYWKYQYKGMPREPVNVDLRITEEKKIEGKNYFHFSTWFYLTRNSPEGDLWIAWHEGVVYRWDGKDEMVLFAPDVKQTELGKNDPSVQVETPAGKFTDLYRFKDCLGCADAGAEFLFARNVGIVSVSMSAIWGGASYELIATNANVP
jgi:hypothetical protein